MNTLKLSIIAFIFFSISLDNYAQYTDTLTLIDEMTEVHSAYDIKVSESGTVYLADGPAGVYIYSFNGTQFSKTGSINESDFLDILNIEIFGDTLIYVLDGDRGIKLFKFDGISYNQFAKLDTNQLTRSIAFGNDGTLFLANANEGLRAYKCDDSKFINAGHIYEDAYAWDVAVINDITILLACGTDGLYIYNYNGTSFTQRAHVDDGGSALSIAIDSNGTIFLANGYDGLRAYSYDNGQLTNIAHINNGGYAWEADLTSDGTIFLANNDDGLRAYSFNDSSFVNTASADIPVADVAVGFGNIIFAAKKSIGIYAYSYSGFTTNTQNISVLNYDLVTLSQNYPNPFDNTTRIEYEIKFEAYITIKIYSIQGQEIVSFVNTHLNPGRYYVQFNGNDFPSGIYYYKIISGKSLNSIEKTKKMVLLK